MVSRNTAYSKRYLNISKHDHTKVVCTTPDRESRKSGMSTLPLVQDSLETRPEPTMKRSRIDLGTFFVKLSAI